MIDPTGKLGEAPVTLVEVEPRPAEATESPVGQFRMTLDQVLGLLATLSELTEQGEEPIPKELRAILDLGRNALKSLAELLEAADWHQEESINAISGAEKSTEPNTVLTKRQQEILQLLARGMSNQEIGQELWLGVGTVEKHLNNIYKKLAVKNRVGVILWAYGEGHITLDEKYREKATSVEGLSPRESEIFALIASDLTNDEIAARLGVLVGTIEKHINRFYRKLGVRDRLEAVLVALAAAEPDKQRER